MIFIIKEDKDGQYAMLGYLYTHTPDENMRHVVGERLQDFVAFSKDNIPRDATFGMRNFGNLTLGEVRARYMMWPWRCIGTKDMPDYIIVWEDTGEPVEGYGLYE
ncbi:MAG: hypothetical protein PHW14_07215, partial [Candidatus Omnitrophica bacterium]|nr:hypothetical protein [Candidatus Omnitrophota bacterium]